MSSPNNGDEAGAQPNNGDEAGAQGSDSQHNTTSGLWSSPSDPCPSIDRAARRAETQDPTYNPIDEEVQFNNFNEGLRGVVIYIYTYVPNIYDWLFFIDNFSIPEPNGGKCIGFRTRGN